MTLPRDLRRHLAGLPSTFSLDDVVSLAPVLQEQHPGEPDILHAIQETVKEWTASGAITSKVGGTFSQPPASASDWPIKAGEEVTRDEICSRLGFKSNALRGKGMHKASWNEGKRFSHDLLLFHQVDRAYYLDHLLPDSRVLYVGTGKEEHGDQSLSNHPGYLNGHLANHVEQAINVRFFAQVSANAKTLRYHGSMMVERVRYAWEASQNRHVYRFALVPANASDVRASFGSTIRIVGSDDPREREPSPRQVTRSSRLARDRAFSFHVKRAYRNSCAVCGTPLAGHSGVPHEERLDLQGAHIQAVEADGPDWIRNGICLCARHHWAFDHGVFSLTNDFEIVLGSSTDPHDEILDGDRVMVPSRSSELPAAEFMDWHRTNWGFA